MSSPAMICNLQYRVTEFHKGRLTAQQQKLKIQTKDMFKYYDRDDACDKTICMKDSFDYYDYRVGSTGGFNNKGSISASESIDNANKYKPEIMYRMVLSFTDEFATEHNLKTKKNMQQLIQKSMNKNFIEMGFDPENIEWSAYYHTNTKSPHVHIAFYERVPTRKKATIQQKKFLKVRSNLYKNISQNIEIYVNRDDIKKRLIDKVKEWNISDEMKKTALHSLNNHKSIFKADDKIVQQLLKLEKQLPKKGSMKYNSTNIKPYHDDIKNIINNILVNDKVNDFYQEYLNQLDVEMNLQEKLYGAGTKEYNNSNGDVNVGVGQGKELQDNFKQKKLFEIETQLGNLILQNILSFRNDMDMEVEENPNEEQKSETKKLGIRKQRRNIKSRQSIMQYGTVHELSKAIEESFYAQQKMRSMEHDVLMKAKEEIMSKTR